MLNLNKFSLENLDKIQKVLKIVLDTIDLQGVNKFRYNKIPIKTFREKGLYYEDVVSVLDKINEGNNAIVVVNEYYREKKEKENSFFSPYYKPSKFIPLGIEIIKEGIEKELHPIESLIEKELHPIESLRVEGEIDTNIIVIVKNLNKIKSIRKDLEKKIEELKIKKLKKCREKKLPREFIKSINEQSKKLEKIEKDFTSLYNKSGYKESLEEAGKRFTFLYNQMQPLKKTLEAVSINFPSLGKNYSGALTSATQRLVMPIKRLEKQMESIQNNLKIPNVETLESSGAIVSPEIIQRRQETQVASNIASELREIKKLIQGLLSGNAKQKQKPIPVNIVKSKELKVKLEEKAIIEKHKDKRIILQKLPADTKWENITIQFLDGQEVIIKAKNKTWHTNYEEMGFQDERRKLPNRQWDFLTRLAVKGGKISWENNRDLSLKEINAIKKRKQLLAEALKKYFYQIEEEPFYSYKEENEYKIKINLIPEAGSEMSPNERRVPEEEKDELGLKEEYEKQTPTVYSEYE